MRAEIICVGTELLLGDIVNTNAQFIAQRLSSLGISVYNQQVVGDNPDRLRQAAQLAKDRSDIVIYTGGLGPTDDDLTKQTVASVYNDTLEFNQKICDDIQSYFTTIGRTMTENNKKQAYVPVKGRFIENNYGTAPGIMFIDGEKMAVLMPGVPREMKPMLDNSVMPMLSKLVKGIIVSRYVRVIGIGESALEEKVAVLLGNDNPTAALYAKEGEVTIRLTAHAEDKAAANEMLDKLYSKLDSLIHNNIYGVDVDNIETVLVNKLIADKKTVATAESCTGGGLSARITSVPGASSVFSLGVCTYSDDQKQKVLGVNPEDLDIYTAVSSPVVTQMAQGIRARSGADYAIATTGYAGPGGGTPQEPVGTVYIAVATADKTFVKKCSFSGDRARITHLACQNAFALLRCVVYNLPCEGVRIIDATEGMVEIEDEKPKKKGGCLKFFLTSFLLVLVSIGIAAGYLWFKYDGNLQLPAIDLPAITQNVTDKVTDFIQGILNKKPADVSALLAERQTQDFFSQGFEKQTVKMVADLQSQNHNMEGWLTFKNSKQEYPVFSSVNTLDDGMEIYAMPSGYISDYKFISGFDTDNMFDLTDINTVRLNSSFVMFDSEGYKEYQI
ncbi:MAG: competence/damage-inducible protein A, partial [Oscillospiraceae bacterium]|nr:competence/damage-inducible protein A [Oscillospiraceae bacterium]